VDWGEELRSYCISSEESRGIKMTKRPFAWYRLATLYQAKPNKEDMQIKTNEQSRQDWQTRVLG
jgi:hypothetical protein